MLDFSQIQVEVTPVAAEKIKELQQREGKSDAALRVFVKAGGCSGYSYGLAFDDRINEKDIKQTLEGLSLVVDPESLSVIEGSQIDYVDSLMGSGFAINNPNAVSSCACGQSFNTDGSPARPGACAQ